MRDDLLVSVIIGNRNYERFIGQAIASALEQTYPHVEVVVVDDGSTDASRERISAFGDLVVPVFKENGGMASACNAGFAVSHGDIVLFLDSDDLLLPSALAQVTQAFAEKEGPIAKFHWPLHVIDSAGARTGAVVPGQTLDEGDFRELTMARGPDAYLSPPTSGNAWSRDFLKSVLPIPERDFKQHADTYLATLAPIFGTIGRIVQPQSLYRIHGSNDYAGRSTREQNRRNLEMFGRRSQALSRFASRWLGPMIDPETWKAANPYYDWMQRLDVALDELDRAIPSGDAFILVDDAHWAQREAGGDLLDGRRSIPFLERDGQYWGPPPDGQTALRELDRLRHSGASFIAFGWPAFWWFDVFPDFADHLWSRYPSLLDNERVQLFDLRTA